MRVWLAFLGTLIALALAAGCGIEETPAPPPPQAPAATAAPAPTARVATPTPAATPTPLPPTDTPTITPTPTQTPTPTITPTPTQTPTPTITPTPTPTPTPTQTPFQEINFTGVTTLTNSPSQVQVVFSLRDQDGHAIVLPAEEIADAARVYERADRDDDWEEIDYSETSYFVHTAENFQLEVVFVLDFTNSMAQATLPDGRSGIDAMLSAFESAVLTLPGAHRIGVVEFHDRNAEPSVLSRPTIDRSSVLASVRRFAQSGFDHGSSRVWDSLAAASDLFSREAGVVKALVFLSDGRDTSSLNTREQAAAYARERKVQLYALSVGDVYEEDELRAAALQTEGSYYRAQQFAGLEDQLETIVGDLRGQYKISYITLRRAGWYQARISVTLRGAEGNFHTETFDVARFFGPDNRGVVQFDPASVDRASGQATLFMRALHVPRNIGRIRFRLETSKPVAAELVAGADGGLLDGWSLSGPDADGFFEASSDDPIEFGNFGPLFRLTLSGITDDRLHIPVAFDDAIYTGGKGFSHPSRIAIGQPVKMYWIDGEPDRIQRANLDGSQVEDVLTRLPSPLGLALDVAAGKMYWTDLGTKKIQRANLDGSEVEDLVTSGLEAPLGIALDVAAGKMYWTDQSTNKIQRANLDGSEVEDLVTSGLETPLGIALDVTAGKIYWTDLGTQKIQRANLDGSEVEVLVTSGLASPFSIALDVAAGKMYWTDQSTNKIQRANLDGSEVEDLVTSGLETPLGIALDVAAGKMYWTNAGTDKIQRANLDGSGVEDLVTGLNDPYTIALELD